MSKFFKRSVAWGVTIATTILTFLPDSIILEKVKLFDKWTDDQNLLIDRIGILIAAFLVSLLLNILFDRFRCKTTIKGNGYSIQVEYGDLFKCKKCQKVIPFDECFTTKIGMAPHEIKAASICGQYLSKNSNLDVQKLIADAGLNPDEEKSKFNNQTKYESGLIVPYGDDLLLAFAKLDINGKGYFPTREAYLNSLAVMWSEIYKYNQQKDVCIPVLGGGLTSIGETTPTQQELVDLIIESYKLFTHKIKNPQKLRIICRRKDDISLSKIGEMI